MTSSSWKVTGRDGTSHQARAGSSASYGGRAGIRAACSCGWESSRACRSESQLWKDARAHLAGALMGKPVETPRAPELHQGELPL